MSICSSSKAMKLWPPHSLGETEQKEVGSSHLLKVWTSLLQGYSLLQQRGSATFLVLHSQQGQHSNTHAVVSTGAACADQCGRL